MALFHRRTGNGTRRNRTTGELHSQSRSHMLASATLVNRKQIRSATSTRNKSWQQEAWSFFDTIGELHAAVRWMGNALSRAKLFVAEAEGDGGEPAPAEDPPQAAQDVLDELHAGTIGQAEMLRRLATNLDIVGEAYLVRLPKRLDPGSTPADEPYRWIVASTDEFSYSQGRSGLKLPEDGSRIDLDPEKVTVIRLWNPHPRQAWEPDSPIRANLPVLREVMSLSQHITATVESRLAGAGVLAIPKSATLPNPNVQEGSNPMHHNAFVDALMQGMVTPITDRDNASAVVPIVLSVDDEAIGKLQHLTFSTDLDSQVTEMRKDALARFAAGTDLPQELITGLGESSHWNASEIEDQAIKTAIEPAVGVICDALTQQLLWPALRAMGEKDPEKWCIWYSAAELSQRPDRSQEAQALYDKGVLSPETLLRENGFNEDDLPNEDDRRKEFARQICLAKPELMAALAPWVGFEGIEDRLQEAAQSGKAQQQQPGQEPGQQGPMDPEHDPALDPAGQQQALPSGGAQPRPQSGAQQSPQHQQQMRALTASGADTAAKAREWQVTAVELVALRALELAGNRMIKNGPRGVRGQYQNLPSWEMHTVAPVPPDLDKVLARAWDVAEPVIGDQPCLRRTVEDYVRTLLSTGTPHRREYLDRALQHAGCAEYAAS